jgi:hypothetical protein
MRNKPRQSLGDDVEALFDRQVFIKMRFRMIGNSPWITNSFVSVGQAYSP